MKGYITTSGKCYIFPQEAGQIPEVEAEVYFVQQEDYVAWVEANESLADKISPYNYNVITVNPKEWSGHTDDDLEPAYTITLAGPYAEHFTLSASSAYEGTRIAVVPESEDYYPENVTVTTSPSTNIDWQERDPEWHFTMPAADVTVTTAATPTTFNINVIGDGTGVDSITSDGEGIEYGTTVTVVCKTDYEVRNVETVNTHESVSYTLTDTLTWQFTMPQDDIYLEIQPVQTTDPNEQ